MRTPSARVDTYGRTNGSIIAAERKKGVGPAEHRRRLATGLSCRRRAGK